MYEQDLLRLNEFIRLLQERPDTVYTSELNFFREYLLSLGATLPQLESFNKREVPISSRVTDSGRYRRTFKLRNILRRCETGICTKCQRDKQRRRRKRIELDREEEIEDFIVDEDLSEALGLDSTGVIESDEDLDLEFGNSKRRTETADVKKIEQLRRQARDSLEIGDYQEALKNLTEAIVLNPRNSLSFARRAEVLVMMQKPNNAIKDASRAISLNSDQSMAYRVRGMAHRALGHWERAARDLNTSLSMDFNEEAANCLLEFSENVKKIKSYRQRARRNEATELDARKARIADLTREPVVNSSFSFIQNGPTALDECLRNAQHDPELLALADDPGIFSALQQIFENHQTARMYQNDVRVMKFLKLFSDRLGVQTNFLGL